MIISVYSRNQVKRMYKKDPMFYKQHWFISIFSSEMEDQNGKTASYSPLPDGANILKLKFDDVTEKDSNYYIHFNSNHAKKIVDFIKNIKDDGSMDMIIHCDAGVSRSGAVGYLLNEWFNKFINVNLTDDSYFHMRNSHIMPNPEVVRILKLELFGAPFMGIKVNDYEYNSDGVRIDHIEEI